MAVLQGTDHGFVVDFGIESGGIVVAEADCIGC